MMELMTKVRKEMTMTIKERVYLSKKDENHPERNRLIEEHMPYLIKVIANHTGRYIAVENAPELSIALEAFNEAIDRFDSSKGSFLPYSALVVKSRLNDWLKKTAQIALHEEMPETFDAVSDARGVEDSYIVKEEIAAYLKRLDSFGITLDELIETAPKHAKTRQENADLSRGIADDDPLSEKLYRTKKLPMGEIVLKFRATKKKLVRFRAYLIALVIVFRERFEHIQTFIEGGERGA